MKFLRTAILAVMAQCALLLAQPEGIIMNPTQGPPQVGWTPINYYSAGLVTYQCRARTIQQSSGSDQSLTVSAATNANPAVMTSTGHGLGDFATYGATITPAVKITGFTGAWTPCNGSWVATTTSANAFSVPCDSTAFGAFGAQTPTVVTTAPRWNQNNWAIAKFFYDGSSNLIGWGWASSPVGAGSAQPTVGGTTNPIFACSNRAAYSYQ